LKEISELLGNLFDKNFIQEGSEYLKFTGSWEDIVGPDIYSHVKIDDLIDKNLIVKADHPGWAQVFLLKKKAILGKVQKKFPQLEIKNIQIRYKDGVVQQKNDKKRVVKEIKTEEKPENTEDLGFFDLLEKFKERSDSES